jgi:hypothetical protein
MVFTETIIPLDTVLYKGMARGVKCSTLLKETRSFYLTESRQTARTYGAPCPFRVTHKLRLFDLTHANIQLLLKVYPLSDETKMLVQVATGTNLTLGQQTAAVRSLFGDSAAKGYPAAHNRRRGQRLSFTELNHKAFGGLTREFLRVEKYDGYYARAKESAFHHGKFHSEIMLTNAYRNIERTNHLPIVSHTSIAAAMPRIFGEFCKRTTRLTRAYGGGLVIFCTGGMAVKMYLEQRRVPLPPPIRRTSDYDFSFAVPRYLKSERQLATYVYSMRKIMSAHMNSFIKYLNRNYAGCNARLRVVRFTRSPHDNPRMQIPTTKRRIYQVMTYQVLTGRAEATDLVDTALAVYPGIKRSDLHMPYSYKLGIPIQRLRYQYKDALAILSGSLVYDGLISHRNPIVGKVKEKGLKDTIRVERFMRVIASDPRHYANLLPISRKAVPLLEGVLAQNLKGAKAAARSVEKMVSRIT